MKSLKKTIRAWMSYALRNDFDFLGNHVFNGSISSNHNFQFLIGEFLWNRFINTARPAGPLICWRVIASSPPYTTRLPPNLLSKLLSNAPHTGNETLMATSATSRTEASLSKAACTAYADAAWVWHMQQKRLGLDPILQRAHTESQNSVTVIVLENALQGASGAKYRCPPLRVSITPFYFSHGCFSTFSLDLPGQLHCTIRTSPCRIP